MTKKEFKKLFARDKQIWYLEKLRDALIEACIKEDCLPPEFIERYELSTAELETNLASAQVMHSHTYNESERAVIMSVVEELETRLLKLQKQAEWSKKKTSKKSKEQIPLEVLKQYPITNVCDGRNIQRIKAGSNRERILCPGHNEKTPSCVIYTDQNTFYCYSCSKGHSVIDFIMLVDNLTAAEAISKLRSIMPVNISP